jgi:glycerol-3-phosphate dehydrogenase
MTLHQQVENLPMPSPLTTDVYDVAVVGAGVVGCAVARRFALEGARVVVIEKATDILDGASKANSAILHTGFDAPPNSLELSCIREGYQEYKEIQLEMGLPLETSGAHVIAWSDEEAARLEHIAVQAANNGVAGVEMISAVELYRREPFLSKHALAAVTVPGESIIDPWSAPYAYLRQSLENGATVYLACEVTGGANDDGKWLLETSRGNLTCRHVINCAGLYGDTLDEMLLGDAEFEIKPRKGQFVVFDKAATRLINSILLPVPTEKTKGIVITRTVFGNVLVGPTAEDQESRTDTSTDKTTLVSLLASAEKIIPELSNVPVTAVYAGLRPATEHKHYRIEAQSGRNWITVGGIRSTGLSSALGIARHVFDLYRKQAEKLHPIEQPKIPNVLSLAESGQRDWQREGHGEIVCHCELVTEREIKNALTEPLAARSLSGLKRQTRATMGRCQGFYCSARLAELTEGRFDVPLSIGSRHA